MGIKKWLDLDYLRQVEEVNRPVILAGLGIVGFWTAIGAAYKAAPKVSAVIGSHKERLAQAETKEEKSKVLVDEVKTVAVTVGPALVLGAAATGAVVKSSNIATKRLAVVTTAYTLAENRLREVSNKLDEVRKNGSKDVREKLSKDTMSTVDIPEDDSIMIEHTGKGNVLCYDEYRGRPFYSCAEAIGQAINTISYRLQTEMWVSLNEFYYELGLTPCKMGDDLGWNVDMVDRGRIPVYYTAVLTENKRPCLAVQFDVQVRKDMIGG